MNVYQPNKMLKKQNKTKNKWNTQGKDWCAVAKKKCALHFLDEAEIEGQSLTVPLYSIFQN